MAFMKLANLRKLLGGGMIFLAIPGIRHCYPILWTFLFERETIAMAGMGLHIIFVFGIPSLLLLLGGVFVFFTNLPANKEENSMHEKVFPLNTIFLLCIFVLSIGFWEWHFRSRERASLSIKQRIQIQLLREAEKAFVKAEQNGQNEAMALKAEQVASFHFELRDQENYEKWKEIGKRYQKKGAQNPEKK
jgi:hypothetical protein